MDNIAITVLHPAFGAVPQDAILLDASKVAQILRVPQAGHPGVSPNREEILAGGRELRSCSMSAI